MKLRSAEGFAYGEEAKPGVPFKIPRETLLRLALASEYAQVRRTPVDGIFVSPSALDSYVWFGVIFIRKGIFGGGIFRFTIYIPKDFPDTVTLPEVVFENSIFHPLIELKTKKLDLTRSFVDGWKQDKHNLLRVLIVIQRIFFSFQFDCERCVNPEAAILYREDRDKFRAIAKETVETSRAEVYEDPPNMKDSCSIKFTPWDATLHGQVRREMMVIGSGQRAVQSPSLMKNRKLVTPTVAEFRRDRDVRERGIVVSDLVGKSFPKTYSWFDTEGKTVLTDEIEKDMDSALSSARERAEHGIEPLDLSLMSAPPSKNNTPRDDEEDRYRDAAADADRKLSKSENLEVGIEQTGEESVI